MPAIHYSFIATISASTLSSRMKLVLIILCSHAQERNWLQISIKSLTSLTSTSERHLRRIIHQLASRNLIRIEYRKGLTSVYHFPNSYQEVDGKLQALWHDSPARSSTVNMVQSGQDDQEQHHRHLFPRPVTVVPRANDTRVDPAMISVWHECFGIRYRPVSVEEERAMDWMIYAQQNKKLCRIKSPVGFLKKIVANGHPDDFPSFAERRAKAIVQSKVNDRDDQDAVRQVEQSWRKYENLPEARQNRLARRFQQEVIEKNRVRKVQDLFQKEGMDNMIIRSLFKTYIHERLGA